MEKAAIEIFYAYASEGEDLCKKLEKHLHPLIRDGLITAWNQRNITAGTEWATDRRLNTAHIILLLISPDFIASDYCYSVEMGRALERHDEGSARVIPIILCPAMWKNMPFGKLDEIPSATDSSRVSEHSKDTEWRCFSAHGSAPTLCPAATQCSLLGRAGTSKGGARHR